jgi:hypothetical protein
LLQVIVFYAKQMNSLYMISSFNLLPDTYNSSADTFLISKQVSLSQYNLGISITSGNDISLTKYSSEPCLIWNLMFDWNMEVDLPRKVIFIENYGILLSLLESRYPTLLKFNPDTGETDSNDNHIVIFDIQLEWMINRDSFSVISEELLTCFEK